jgi:general secretion pathway protein G
MKRLLENRRSEKGFTLLELIIVLVILGLLAALVVPKVMERASKSKEQVALLQIKDLEGALQLFSFDLGRYPTTAEGLGSLIVNPGIESWNGPYLGKNVIPKDPWKKDYGYRSPGMHGDFDLYSLGPDGAEGGDDDICSWK